MRAKCIKGGPLAYQVITKICCLPPELDNSHSTFGS